LSLKKLLHRKRVTAEAVEGAAEVEAVAAQTGLSCGGF
jgi:hypothetical protein